jgi:hypothetical protein
MSPKRKRNWKYPNHLGRIIHTGGDMAERKQMELEPPRKLKVRTIQTVRFGKSKVNIKLADKTLRKIMKERESKGLAS